MQTKTIGSMNTSACLGCLFYCCFFCSSVFAINDPTRAFSSSKSQSSINENLVLQGIFRRNNENTAIINGKAFLLGDKVSTYTLKKIHKNSVELSQGDRLLYLELRKNIRE